MSPMKRLRASLDIQVNPSTGALTAVSGSPLATGGAPGALAVEESGQVSSRNVLRRPMSPLQSGRNSRVCRYHAEQRNPRCTPVRRWPPAPFQARALAIDPSGLFAYVANDGSGDISVYAVDATTGALSAVGNSPVASGNEPRSIAID